MVTSPASMKSPVDAAAALAEEVLFPGAIEIDRAQLVPLPYLDAIAQAGLYGLLAPASAGGYQASEPDAAKVIEHLGGASLSAAFVWVQHNGAVRAVADSPLDRQWSAPLCRGDIRSGIAVAALRRPGPPALRAEAVNGGWLLTGHSPWVTGWGRIDVCFAGAREGEAVVWVLADAKESHTLRVEPLQLASMTSTGTVSVSWDRHFVPEERVVGVEAFSHWQLRDAMGLRTNGYLAIGVAARAASLLGPSSLDRQVAAARRSLQRASALSNDGPGSLVQARARASLLALRATSALVVAGGGRSMDVNAHAQRLAREAMFLLVFGQTRAIRRAQLADLAPPVEPPAEPRSPKGHSRN